MGVDVDPVLIFSFMAVIGYWVMLNAFYEKNNYCSVQHNDIIKERAKGNKKLSKILSLNLSTQLLAMDLWSHRIYSPSFVENLEDAITFCYSAENKYFQPSYESKEACFEAANNRKMEVGVARSMLLSLQYSLEDSI
ncbi:MAG: hypothetical protein HON90_16440 [Halobacteriovoraceae bacterium]|nr:hypothetical protein [Halobacteriovoraceae bacterium]